MKEEEIFNKVEKELGFRKGLVKNIRAKSLGIFQDKKIDNFDLECENIYQDRYKCKGEFNKKTRSLVNIDCEKL